MKPATLIFITIINALVCFEVGAIRDYISLGLLPIPSQLEMLFPLVSQARFSSSQPSLPEPSFEGRLKGASWPIAEVLTSKPGLVYEVKELSRNSTGALALSWDLVNASGETLYLGDPNKSDFRPELVALTLHTKGVSLGSAEGSCILPEMIGVGERVICNLFYPQTRLPATGTASVRLPASQQNLKLFLNI